MRAYASAHTSILLRSSRAKSLVSIFDATSDTTAITIATITSIILTLSYSISPLHNDYINGRWFVLLYEFVSCWYAAIYIKVYLPIDIFPDFANLVQ